jgi:8-oxo-dGTP pyrophosphatase MutT (NUDIX family)
MSYRAGIVLLQEDKVALIERHRAGLRYFTFPGGHVDKGETPEQAAVRETKEELGLQVTLKQLLAQFGWHGKWQYYYLVNVTGGTFGSGSGEEMFDSLPERGTYRPMWMPIAKLLDQPVKPRELAEMVIRFSKEGWPEEPIIIPENFSTVDRG